MFINSMATWLFTLSVLWIEDLEFKLGLRKVWRAYRVDQAWEELNEEPASVRPGCVNCFQGSSIYSQLLFPAATKDTAGEVQKVSLIYSQWFLFF